MFGGGITIGLNCAHSVLASGGTGKKIGVCVSASKVMYALVDEVGSLEVEAECWGACD